MQRFVPLLVLLALAMPARAGACAPCGAGDPTLTRMGSDVPFAGRARLAVELRHYWDRIDVAGLDASELHEVALGLAISWAPTDWLSLSGSMPIVLRDVRRASLSHTTTLGPGDAELRARVILLRDAAFAPSHLFGAHAGVELPTSIDQVGPNGARLDAGAQTGSGTVDPLAGVFYTHLADPWALFLSATVSLPQAPRYDDAPGPSMRASAAVQHRLDRHFTLRGGLDVRLDAPSIIAGQSDPRTDRFVLFASPDLLWSPLSDLVLSLGLRVPLVQVSEERRTEGLYTIVSLVVDA